MYKLFRHPTIIWYACSARTLFTCDLTCSSVCSKFKPEMSTLALSLSHSVHCLCFICGCACGVSFDCVHATQLCPIYICVCVFVCIYMQLEFVSLKVRWLALYATAFSIIFPYISRAIPLKHIFRLFRFLCITIHHRFVSFPFSFDRKFRYWIENLECRLLIKMEHKK